MTPYLTHYKLSSFSALICIAIASLLSLPVSASPVYVGVRNQCRHPIRIAVLAYRIVGQKYTGWDEGGWWKFNPGEQDLLNDNGLIEIPPDDPKLAPFVSYYAETTDGSGIVWSGKNTYSTSNLPNPLRLSDGSLLHYRDAKKLSSNGMLTLTCPGK